MKCPKCEGEMEKGLIVDKGHLSWPENPLWGTSKTFFGGVQNKREVVTYRCITCGYLESYAKNEVAKVITKKVR